MYYLLFTDVHLDDQAQNEYRWLIWEHVRSALMQYEVDTVFCLGDLVDRKDRFSSAFVNRLLAEMRGVSARAPLVVLRGNHDQTLRPPNYFDFLNSFSGSSGFNVDYVTEPTRYSDDLLLLPYSHAPRDEWAGHRLSDFQAVFMHATVTGARVENGQVMENTDFPLLPGRVKFYSGDIHVPQQVRNITYVGAPHPIKFGDDYPCRMLLLDRNFDVAMEIPLTGPRKVVAQVSSLADLEKLHVRSGDQVKIQCSITSDQVGKWHLDDARVAEWARSHGVTIAGVEVVLETTHSDPGLNLNETPAALLRQFASQEKLSDDLVAVGLRLLEGAER